VRANQMGSIAHGSEHGDRSERFKAPKRRDRRAGSESRR
jgi:hypothetical protein